MVPTKVCVVDDCVDEVAVLCDGLKLHDYEPIAAYTGQEALEICANQGVDLILLDVMLPDTDGFEVCRQLKQLPAAKDIPVIFVTGKNSNDDVQLGFDLGAVDYVIKPYNLPTVMLKVEIALQNQNNVRASAGFADDLIQDLVYTDTLTGLRNRRFLLERLEEEVDKAHRYNYPVSCLVVDVEEAEAELSREELQDLKDTLADIALAMRSSSRNYDILARYDDALFAAVLPHTSLKNALTYARKIRREIDDNLWEEANPNTKPQISFGIVSCRNGVARNAEHLLGEAMRELLKAKSCTNDRIFARDLAEEEENKN